MEKDSPILREVHCSLARSKLAQTRFRTSSFRKSLSSVNRLYCGDNSTASALRFGSVDRDIHSFMQTYTARSDIADSSRPSRKSISPRLATFRRSLAASRLLSLAETTAWNVPAFPPAAI